MGFLHQKVFHFLMRHRAFQMVSSCVSFDKLYFLRRLSISSKLLNLLAWHCLKCPLITLLKPIDFVIMCFFLFQILILCVIFFLQSCQSLHILFKKQLLTLLIICQFSSLLLFSPVLIVFLFLILTTCLTFSQFFQLFVKEAQIIDFICLFFKHSYHNFCSMHHFICI